MKIQTKKGLLHTFRDDPSRVDYEVKAFVKSNHPYIINLDYAFQTDSLAIMVLLVFLISMNIAAVFLRKKYETKW